MPRKPSLLIEPFSGGGIITLTAILENLCRKAIMVELDDDVAAVWETILKGDVYWLVDRILEFKISEESVEAEMSRAPRSVKEIAFQTFLRNRTYHGGILAQGSSVIRYGENGKGISSRWYPETLSRRIMAIYKARDRIGFVHGDGMEFLKRYHDKDRTVFFIDPPYTAAGKKAGRRLYTHNSLDHEELFELAEKLRGRFLMTYDNTQEIREMAKSHGFQYETVPMKNTHNTEMLELLIWNYR